MTSDNFLNFSTFGMGGGGVGRAQRPLISANAKGRKSIISSTHQWRIQGGARDTRPSPPWFKFFYFHASFFGNNFVKE